VLGSDAFFRRLVESSGDGVWAFDAHGRTVFANQRLADLLGYSVAELESMSVLDVLDEEGQRQFRDHLAELARVGPNRYDADCVYRHRDGTPVPLTVGEHAIEGADGELLCYVHRVTDDLHRRDLLSEVSQSRRQLDEAQSIARLGSWEMDLVSGGVTFSRQMFRLLGLHPDEDVPTPRAFFERLVEADRPAVRTALGEAHRTGGEFSFDARVRHRPGRDSVVWLRGLGRYKTDASGRPVRVGGTLQDVTEVKEAEHQLLDAVVLNALMQVMATAANESQTLVEAVEVVRRQLLGHEDWVRAVGFTVANDDGEATLSPYLGPRGEADRAPNDDERAVAEQVMALRATVFEESTRPQNPSLGFLIGAEDGPVMVVVITAASPFERHDMLEAMTQQVSRQLATVAERERATQQLAEARDAAMQASRLKSEFVAMMSHEIRTPMNGVIGLNDLLLRSDLDDYQRRLATGVQTAGRSLLGVINDILDFSKIEAGQLELESLEFDLEGVVDQTLTVLSGVAADKELHITTRIDPELPPRLVGDPTRLGQVVSNLVSNAVKFTHAGRIDISATVTASNTDDVEVTVEVADTGVGIPAEVREHLFEPFRQADASTTRTFGGTGLGLAICHQLVAAMGGRIGVTSEPGRGSTFWFTVPFGRGTGTGALTGPSGPVRTAGGRAGERGRILVVEDNDINQLVALGLLEALGYAAVVVDNGLDAVAEVQGGRTGAGYDAVLMDIQMPGMDGYAAARRIREVEPEGRRTPIIAMTASAMQGERERCLAAGMDDYLSKPVASHRLEHVLGRFLGGTAGVLPVDEVTAQPPEHSVLDVSRLEELDALGDGAAALVTRAIRNFIANAPETLAELERSHRDHDCEQVAARAHRLKGSAWNLGALRVGSLCERLEVEARSDVLVDVEGQVGALRVAYADAARALREYRGLDETESLPARAG
jgi:PAS domain S-box-containing protein